ncbi:YcgJ family protein [Cupriavidus malaysiensis]|uniref:Uncharacterized protein n=1 Tax=Cupriavidus malaysiensis TaxID=367825 RepID=A0ABM6F211_9BURK|nr:YcgJ family protein [Cupriavidus malaysiensis]AOZ05326.1 hypothetical protein BKK80_05515 [Cupriavidus malaysiensis]
MSGSRWPLAFGAFGAFAAFALFLAAGTVSARAVDVHSPAAGVLCDGYICADKDGVSQGLTERYLGKKIAARTFSRGPFDHSAFTFSNGVFCDVKECLCREDRYFNAKGQRSPVSAKYTRLLFGKPAAGASCQAARGQ